MRTLIAIPAMDTLPTVTASALLALRQPHEAQVQFVIRAAVDVARNMLALEAIRGGYDRVLWIDSDQTFDADLMERLNADLDEGWDIVSGLYFSRRAPVEPVIYKAIDAEKRTAERFLDYPRDAVFPIAGCGMGACMMRTEVLARMTEPPFSLMPGVSEDLSFCVRAHRMGVRMACDSRVKVGHYGAMIYTEQHYDHPEG